MQGRFEVGVSSPCRGVGWGGGGMSVGEGAARGRRVETCPHRRSRQTPTPARVLPPPLGSGPSMAGHSGRAVSAPPKAHSDGVEDGPRRVDGLLTSSGKEVVDPQQVGESGTRSGLLERMTRQSYLPTRLPSGLHTLGPNPGTGVKGPPLSTVTLVNPPVGSRVPLPTGPTRPPHPRPSARSSVAVGFGRMDTLLEQWEVVGVKREVNGLHPPTP